MTFIQTIKQVFTKPTPVEIAQGQQFTNVLSRDDFLCARDAFKEKASAKQITAVDILLYNILRGKKMDRGFTTVTNPNKLANGEGRYHGNRRLYESEHYLRAILARFVRGETPHPFIVHYELTPETCARIITKLDEKE